MTALVPGGGPRLLVSARDAAEAEIALLGGADVVDMKEPAAGALGAVAPDVLAAAIAAVAGRRPVSATTGDIPCEAVDAVVESALAVAAAGADYVKVGLFSSSRGSAAIVSGGTAASDGLSAKSSADGPLDPAIARLVAALGERVVPKARTVAVAFADQGIDEGLFAALAAAGFAGVVVDTADKAAGRLRDHLDGAALARLVDDAHRHGLFIGLAGSLRAADIAPVARLNPDLVGVRGAACVAHDRVARIDRTAVAAVAAELAAATVGTAAGPVPARDAATPAGTVRPSAAQRPSAA